jgi:hypothetical protein
MYSNISAPVVAEHSGGYGDVEYSAYVHPILFGSPNIHSINDTWSEVNEITIVHIPDVFLVEEIEECQ